MSNVIKTANKLHITSTAHTQEVRETQNTLSLGYGNAFVIKNKRQDVNSKYFSKLVPTTQILGMTALRGFSQVKLSWIEVGNPHSYRHTEVLRSTINDPNSATVVGHTSTPSYVDSVDFDADYYYWLKVITYSDQASELSDVLPSLASSASYSSLLGLLSDADLTHLVNLDGILGDIAQIQNFLNSGLSDFLTSANIATLEGTIEVVRQMTLDAETNMLAIRDSIIATSDVNKAELVDQLTVQANQYGALASRLSTTEAGFATDTARLSALVEEVTRVETDAHAAIAEAKTTLTSEYEGAVNLAKAEVEQYVRTYASENLATATSVENIDARLTTETSSLDAKIKTEKETRVSATEALARDFEVLDVDMRTIDSNLRGHISTELSALATERSVLAQDVSQLKTDFTGIDGQLTSTITDLTQTYSDANQALGLRVTNMEVQYDNLNNDLINNFATYDDKIQLRVDEHSALALRVNSLETGTTIVDEEGNPIDVSSFITASYFTGTEFASQIATLGYFQDDVNNPINDRVAEVETKSLANETEAYRSVKVNADGVVTGYKIFVEGEAGADGTVENKSTIRFTADKFIIAHDDGSGTFTDFTPFRIENDKVYMNEVIITDSLSLTTDAEGVTTLNLLGNSVSWSGGENGKSAYEIWLLQTGNENKSEADFLNDIVGEPGQKTYVHVRYSNNADGEGFDDNPENKAYIGVYSGDESDVTQLIKTDYSWSAFKGDSPVKGTDYFDGVGNYVSFVFKTGDNTPPDPTGGTYKTSDEPRETLPEGWSDNPVYEDGKKTFVSKRVYQQVSDETTGLLKDEWLALPWSTPTVFFEKGNDGSPGNGVYEIWKLANPDGTDEAFLTEMSPNDGVSQYVHIRYSTNSDGEGFGDSPVGAIYMGVYSGTESDVTKLIKTDFNWSLINDKPIKGTDYVDGTGRYVSFVFTTGNTPPNQIPDEEGSFDGTTEVIPYSDTWSDDPVYKDNEITWVSKRTYTQQLDTSGNASTTWEGSSWSAPSKFYEVGAPGYTPVKGVDYDDGQPGLSAFEEWQAIEGNSDKTITDFVASLKGDAGILPVPDNETKGFYATADYMGYHNGTHWTTFFDNQGRFYFKDPTDTEKNVAYFGGSEFIIRSGDIHVTADKFQINTNTTDTEGNQILKTPFKIVDGKVQLDQVEIADSLTITSSGGTNTLSFLGQEATWSNGASYFNHIKYSPNSDGSTMTDTPEESTLYIGFYTGTEETAPTTNTSYTWARFKGDEGEPANNAVVTEESGEYVMTIDSVEVARWKDGEKPVEGVDYTVTHGVDGITQFVSFVFQNKETKPNTPTDGDYNGTTETFPENWTDDPSATTGDEITWVTKRTYTANVGDDNKLDGTWTASGWTTPTKFYEKGATGSSAFDIWALANPDGTNEQFLEFIKGETATHAYMHIRYSNNADGSGFDDNATNKKYIGVYSGTSSTAPTSEASFTWSLIKGANGIDGIDGVDASGQYISFVFKTGTSKPNKPTDGSYDGTETLPTDWSDDPVFKAGETTWVSKQVYTQTVTDGVAQSTWTGGGWSEPSKFYERGTDGDPGLSAYEVWKAEEGNSDKTVGQFLADIKGDEGILPAPTGNAGLFADGNGLGYHNGTKWSSYIASDGKFYLSTSNDDVFYFDGTSLTIRSADILLEASKFKIDDGSTGVSPFRLEGNTVYMDNVEVTRIDAGVINNFSNDPSSRANLGNMIVNGDLSLVKDGQIQWKDLSEDIRNRFVMITPDDVVNTTGGIRTLSLVNDLTSGFKYIAQINNTSNPPISHANQKITFKVTINSGIPISNPWSTEPTIPSIRVVLWRKKAGQTAEHVQNFDFGTLYGATIKEDFSGGYKWHSYFHVRESYDVGNVIGDYEWYVTLANISGDWGDNYSIVLSLDEPSGGGTTTSHPNITAASSSDNSGNTVIQDITVDSNGHVTGIGTKTISIPSLSGYATETWVTNKGYKTDYRTVTSAPSATSTDEECVSAKWAFDNVKTAVPANAKFTDTTYTTATSTTEGLIKIGYVASDKNYPVKLDSGKAYVNVPWSNTTYTTATSTVAGLIKIGYTAEGKNYPVKLSSGKAYVNVPWSDTTYTAGTNLSLSGGQFNVSNAPSFTGVVTASDFTATSDKRVKENIAPIPNALDKVMQCSGNTYYRTDIEENSAGVIAQELQAVLPESVFERADRMSVKPMAVIGLLLEAIKELKAEVDELKGKD